MIKSDLVAVYPTHIVYPLFNKYIHDNREKFHRVILIFMNMQTNQPNYQNFIEDQLKIDKISFVHPIPIVSGKDWRNEAVKKGLELATGDWIFFTEQDFTPQENFWQEVHGLADRTEAFGYFQEGRLHPCCIFVKREMLDKTSKDFSAYPNKGYDHFGKLQHDLELRTNLGVIHHHLGKHLNGLSQNIFMLQNGETPNYNPPEFKEYCEACLASGFKMPKEMEGLFIEYINR